MSELEFGHPFILEKTAKIDRILANVDKMNLSPIESK